MEFPIFSDDEAALAEIVPDRASSPTADQSSDCTPGARPPGPTVAMEYFATVGDTPRRSMARRSW